MQQLFTIQHNYSIDIIDHFDHYNFNRLRIILYFIFAFCIYSL